MFTSDSWWIDDLRRSCSAGRTRGSLRAFARRPYRGGGCEPDTGRGRRRGRSARRDAGAETARPDESDAAGRARVRVGRARGLGRAPVEAVVGADAGTRAVP